MFTDYKGNLAANTRRGPSPAIWADLPMLEILANPDRGVHEFHDFLTGGKITAPTTEAALVGLLLSGFSSSASQITYGNAAYSTAQDAGTLTLAETTTAEATSIRSAVTPYRISANYGKLWFETRLKLSTVATNEISFFVGLMEDVAHTVDIPLLAGSTHELADKNVVGFHKPVANTTTFNGTYKADGVTAVVSNSGIGTLAADTYIKLGFTFDPADNKLTWFINGEAQATKKTIPDNTGTDFPADKALGWAIALGVGSAANDNTIIIDWVRCAQMLP